MPRQAKAFFDKRAGCWASSAIGPVRFTKDGKSYRSKVFHKELTHPTKDALAAQAWVHSELERRRAALVPAGDLTFRQLTEFYLEDAERELGAEAYARRVEHLDRFGNWPGPDNPLRMDLRPVRRIASDDVKKFLADMLGAGNSESYVADGLLKSVKRVFRWASEVDPGRFHGLPIPTNPVAKVKGPEKPRRAARDVDPVAVRRFLQWLWRRARGMDARDRKAGRRKINLKGRFARIATILLLCLRDTGARPKELCSAWWEDWQVRPDGWGILTLPWWKHKTGRKTRKPRVIAFPPHCARRIEWIRGLEGRHPDHIFTHRRNRGSAEAGEGSPWAGDPWVEVDAERRKVIGNTKSLQKLVNRLRTEALAAKVPVGFDFRMYFNRSAYSTEAQRRGVPRAMLAEAMGTSERMLERHYTDANEADVLDVAKAVARRQP